MNYDLAVMALDGLRREPLKLHVINGCVKIEGSAASFRELARLCLLLGGDSAVTGDAVELESPGAMAGGSPALHLERVR